jgi:hypothetical protein
MNDRKKNDNQNTSESRPDNSRAGIDRLNESERRYADLESDSVLEDRQGEREREYQERKEGLTKTEQGFEDHRGSGSKTEGAFGEEGGKNRNPKNLGDRKDQ